MVGEELERDDGEDGREEVGGFGDRDDVVGDLSRHLVALGQHTDDDSLARLDLDDVRVGLLVAKLRRVVALLARVDDDDGQALVNKRVRPVLHLARRVAFGVDVGNLFQLQCAFERDGEVDAATEV